MTQSVLIVDADRSIREVVAAILHREAYRVDSASSGASAIELLTVRNYDVVVLDLMMPDVSGFGIIKWMRDHGMRDRSVVLISASSQARIASVDSPLVHSRLQKPFDLVEFQQSVRECASADWDERVSAASMSPR